MRAAIIGARAEGLSAIAGAARKQVPVSIARDAGSLLIGSGLGLEKPRCCWSASIRRMNSGRPRRKQRNTLLESNVVRSLTPIGAWSGSAMTLRQTPPAGDGFAVLLQAEDGRILGVGRHPDRLLLVRPMQGGSESAVAAPTIAGTWGRRCELPIVQTVGVPLIQSPARAIRPW